MDDVLGGHSSKGLQVEDMMRKSGLVLAKVTDISDPDKLNRVKCKPITEDEDVAETEWCFCITPAGGNERGIFFFPNVDDLVVLSFLGGNVHHPIVLGSYWADTVKAPYTVEDGKNEISTIKTVTGIEIKLNDKAEEQQLVVTMPSGLTVTIDDKEKTAVLKDKEAKNSATLNWEKGEMELKADAKITLITGSASLILESGGKITAEGSGAVSIKGSDFTGEATNGATLSGSSVEVKASGELTAQASGNANIKGAKINLN